MIGQLAAWELLKNSFLKLNNHCEQNYCLVFIAWSLQPIFVDQKKESSGHDSWYIYKPCSRLVREIFTSQVLQLLRGETTGVGRLFARAASSVIKEMLRQLPELAQKYVLSPIIEPLAQTTANPGITVF